MLELYKKQRNGRGINYSEAELRVCASCDQTRKHCEEPTQFTLSVTMNEERANPEALRFMSRESFCQHDTWASFICKS